MEEYDAWGNLTSQAGRSGYGGCTEYLRTGLPPGLSNRVAGWSYDNSGNELDVCANDRLRTMIQLTRNFRIGDD
jgi:hypothetical protein